MPEKKTIKGAQQAKREGKSPSTRVRIFRWNKFFEYDTYVAELSKLQSNLWQFSTCCF